MISKKPFSQIQLFYWEGHDSNGITHRGHTFADSQTEVSSQLERNQITATKLAKCRLNTLKTLLSPVSRNDISLFANQLATLLDAGVSLAHGIKLLEQCSTKYSVKLLLYRVHHKVLSGFALSDAMRLTHSSFDHFFIQMVASGEQSGRLSETLGIINLYRNKQQAMRSKLTKAMMYPLAVILTAISVCYILLSQVIPQFESMFAQFNAPLPTLTLSLLGVSTWVSKYSDLIFLLTLLTLLCILLVYHYSLGVRLILHRLMLNLPIIGPIILRSNSIQICRVLVICTQSGIPVLSGIKLSEQLIENCFICDKLRNISREVSEGHTVYSAMVNEKIFPELLLQMVMIGEESGRLEKTLTHLIQHYELEIDNFVANLHQILEPLIVVVMGVIIGAIVLAIYLPIFNLLTVLG